MIVSAEQRPVRSVPPPMLGLLAIGLALQIGWHAWAPQPSARAEDLPAAPDPAVLRVASFGEPIALSKLLMLWLQVFDNQPGISIPFLQLDYAKVEAWLDRILSLDTRTQYPLLAASRLYGAVPDPQKQRQVFDFTYRKFLEDPNRRWPWLAHAAIMARHRLDDLDLALKYSRAIADMATGNEVPGWARQMHIFVLEDAGEVEAARALIGGLLTSGQISDPHELTFLEKQLERMEAEMGRERDKASVAMDGKS